MNNRNALFILLTFFLSTEGWAAGVAVAAPATSPATKTTTPMAPVTATSSPATPKPFYLSYQFYGDRYRDPFISLTSDVQNDKTLDRPPQIASLVLRGIVQDSQGRMALLSSGASSYILRGGRLFNSRNRPIKNISGVIKSDSVVMTGADRTVREIRVKSNLN